MDGSQYGASITTLSSHIVTAAVPGDKLLDRVGGGEFGIEGDGPGWQDTLLHISHG